MRERAAGIRMIATWFEDATAAARALGLDIDLPDVGETDPAFWEAFDRQAWRDALKGKVDMTAEEIDACDPDWVLLKRVDGVEIWFDLEEGVRWRFPASRAGTVAAHIRAAATAGGLTLANEWPGNVLAMPCYLPHEVTYDDLSAVLTPAGWDRQRHGWQLRV